MPDPVTSPCSSFSPPDSRSLTGNRRVAANRSVLLSTETCFTPSTRPAAATSRLQNKSRAAIAHREFHPLPHQQRTRGRLDQFYSGRPVLGCHRKTDEQYGRLFGAV